MTETSTVNSKTRDSNRSYARTGSSIDYTRDVLSRTHTIKTGKTPGNGNHIGALEFSNQKAKAVRLSAYSFPLFVIHKTRPIKDQGFNKDTRTSRGISDRDEDLEQE